MADKIEKPDAVMTQYGVWKTKPSPLSTNDLLKTVEPTINKALMSYGYANDPNMRSTAQLHVLKSLPRYDPTKAHLNTFVMNELRRLQRLGPKQQHAMPMPEQAALDLKDVQRVETEMTQLSGREPTHSELADETGLSVKRIGALKSKYGMPTVTEGQMQSEDMQAPTGSKDDEGNQLWLEATYHGLDHTNKSIMDWSMGLHGKPRLSKTEMANKLNISIPAISQRAQQIHKRLSEGMEYNIL